MLLDLDSCLFPTDEVKSGGWGLYRISFYLAIVSITMVVTSEAGLCRAVALVVNSAVDPLCNYLLINSPGS